MTHSTFRNDELFKLSINSDFVAQVVDFKGCFFSSSNNDTAIGRQSTAEQFVNTFHFSICFKNRHFTCY